MSGAESPGGPVRDPRPARDVLRVAGELVYGEDVAIADWAISTDGLPRYAEPGE
ncbi:hypothetical protein AB0D97_07060 [Streptomyces roseus]|uniref:hypothetical protein n=1 Tax=Streptomyces roseus TaxID=66430 RepID=UPI0033E5A2FF